jgi:hypothetical protein
MLKWWPVKESNLHVLIQSQMHYHYANGQLKLAGAVGFEPTKNLRSTASKAAVKPG